MSITSELKGLRWRKVTIDFKPAPLNPEAVFHAHPICVMEAIVNDISNGTWGLSNKEWQNRPLFHFKNRSHNFRPNPNQTCPVEFIFTSKTASEVDDWIQNLQAHFQREENCRTFYPINLSGPEERSLDDLRDEIGELPESGELCLQFLTPLPFKPRPGKSRYFINSSSLQKGIITRINRLFSASFETSIEPIFETLPYYWDYTEIRHLSHSQPGNYQFINGCVGPLYLRGNFVEIAPWLYLASELHAGTKFSNSAGYFLLQKDSCPYFDLRFPRLDELKGIADEVIERYDEALVNLVQPQEKVFEPKAIVQKLFEQLSSGRYEPLPYKAFSLRTESGKERQVEQPEYIDLIAGLYALRLLSPVLDKALEEESIGFRKGKSREKAIELVREAINQGYLWVVEADIENFFPTINLAKLEDLLEHYLPQKDKIFNQFIKSIIRAPYKIGETVFERQRGVPQGHPLSPCLANLYLDSFDEKVKALGLKLIRYADDFLIFCKTRTDAESAVQEIEKILSGLDLKMKPDKTSIKNVTEGFQFLGYNFSGTQADVFEPPDIRLLKKPLYVTEPYVFVSVEGNAVSVKRNGQIIQTVPLRRISEIMLMEKAVVSSSLITRCLQNKIPLTLTLNSGYFLTTIRPDSKDYFLISSQHAYKYARLSEAALSSLAKEIATVKINNYLHLFKQKYEPELRSLFKNLRDIIKRLETSVEINEIRGLEGLAARHIYSSINILINNEAFHLSKRQRHPPDRINSLLNFGAYLLYSRINALIRSAGLNPYLGFLHSPSDDYESLVSDIVDIFRPRLERFVIRLINLKIIDETSFESKEGAFYLGKEGKHRFLSHFENELNAKSSPEKLSFKEQLSLQVKIIKDWVLKDSSLVFLRWSE